MQCVQLKCYILWPTLWWPFLQEVLFSRWSSPSSTIGGDKVNCLSIQQKKQKQERSVNQTIGKTIYSNCTIEESNYFFFLINMNLNEWWKKEFPLNSESKKKCFVKNTNFNWQLKSVYTTPPCLGIHLNSKCFRFK